MARRQLGFALIDGHLLLGNLDELSSVNVSCQCAKPCPRYDSQRSVCVSVTPGINTDRRAGVPDKPPPRKPPRVGEAWRKIRSGTVSGAVVRRRDGVLGESATRSPGNTQDTWRCASGCLGGMVRVKRLVLGGLRVHRRRRVERGTLSWGCRSGCRAEGLHPSSRSGKCSLIAVDAGSRREDLPRQHSFGPGKTFLFW